MTIIEKAIVQAYHRKRLGSDTHTELGWRGPECQTRRFEILCDWGDMSGCTVMDMGCGYGELKPFLETRFSGIHYLGIDFLSEFIRGAELRYGQSPDAQFIQADFLTAGLPEADIAMASGSLNYCSQDPLHPWQIIRRMWESSRKGVAFNLLNSTVFNP